MDKPWIAADDILAQLKGHMGVFQLANESQEIIYIGYAGGLSQYGLKGEVRAALAGHSSARYVRHEIMTAYMTRFRELMMAHVADYGVQPSGNPVVNLGRLSPA